VCLLTAAGVELLFLNSGTDSAPLQEALAALAERGLPTPRVLTSTFESVALAAAHGFWQATQRPQAVFVHVDVGTQNLGAIVHDVFRDRAGAVVLAGKAPYAEDALLPGARSNPIHWQQDVPDQAGILRSYARWTAELTSPRDAARVIGRAVQVAAGGPGLSYVMLSRDVLMAPAGPPELSRTSGYARPAPPAPEPAALAELAERLAKAARPVIVTSRLGRITTGTSALSEVAQLAAIPVIGRREAVNLPSDHPMCVRSQALATEILTEADLVLITDCDVPWIPRNTSLAPGCCVVQIERDPLKADMPLWSFPVDLALTADPVVSMRQLAAALKSHAAAQRRRWDARRAELEPAIAQDASALRARATNPALPATDIRAVLAVLDRALEAAGGLLVEEAVTNLGAVAELVGRREPGTLYTAGGPGLGWSPGASVGIKLARPERPVVALVGDGSFMFGVPTAALSLAAEANAPVVIVVLNNGGYRASRLPVFELFSDGASARRGEVIGTRFARPPDFVALAAACGAWATRTEGAAGLPEALERALVAAEDGTTAVIDVRIEQA